MTSLTTRTLLSVPPLASGQAPIDAIEGAGYEVAERRDEALR